VVSDVPEVNMVMYLIIRRYFLMHGVVLQNRMLRHANLDR